MNSQIASTDNWDLATNSQRAWMIWNVLSSGTMDKDKIKKLLEAASDEDQIKLKVLHNAVVKCLNDYRKESTSSKLKDWQNAEEALESFVEELWQEHFPEKGSLPNALAVTNYLQDQGWRISKSTVYKHKKEGKIRNQPDGTFSIDDVERYAFQHLDRLDGSTSSDLDKKQQEKADAETKKLNAQAEHWYIKARVLSGQYVDRDIFDRELAARASTLRSDMENFIRGEADRIIGLVEGDQEKVYDLIEYMLEASADWFNRYSEDREWATPQIQLVNE